MFGKYAVWIWACYGLTLAVALGLLVEAVRAPGRARLAARRLRAEAALDAEGDEGTGAAALDPVSPPYGNRP